MLELLFFLILCDTLEIQRVIQLNELQLILLRERNNRLRSEIFLLTFCYSVGWVFFFAFF